MSFLGAKYNVPVSNWTPLDENPLAYYEANSAGVRLLGNANPVLTPIAVYDSDLGITLNGTGVSKWEDQSGSGDSNKNAVQATAINQPIYTLHDPDFNGHGSIEFTGNLKLITGTFSISQPVSYYCVVKSPAINANYVTIFDGINSGNRHSYNFNITNGFPIAIVNSSMLLGITNMRGNKTISCVIINGNSSSISENSVTATNGTLLTGSTDGFTIGNAFGGNQPAGKIAYIAVYPGAHDDSTKARILKDLSNKYNSPVAIPTVVDQLLDQAYSGDANRIANQFILANMPSYTANDSDFNGHGSITFNSISKLVSGYFSSPIPSSSSIYYVFKVPNNSNLGLLLDGPNVTNRQTLYSQNGKIYGFTPTGTICSTVDQRNSIVVVSIVFSGANSKIYINDSTTEVASGFLNQTVMTALVFGQYYANNDCPFLGKMANVSIYGGIHTSTTRNKIMKFLGRKFGVAVS